MIRHYKECYYCGLVNNHGLIYVEELYSNGMCQGCSSIIPNHIPKEQYHNYLMEYYEKRRTDKV